MNRPVNLNDPSGHRACGDTEKYDCDGRPNYPIQPFPSKDDDTPGEIIDDYRRKEGGLGGPTNEITNAVNEYMENNPNYDPYTDPFLIGWTANQFSKIRLEYWNNRATEAGICKICAGEASRLYAYYDLHQKIIMTGWDASRVNWRSAGLDSLSTVLSVVALNEVAQVLRISEPVKDVAAIGVGLNGVRSGAEAISSNDGPGLALTVGGFIPGPIGGVASGGSVFKDLAEGFFTYEWKPSIPR